jgi:hypothetical protein
MPAAAGVCPRGPLAERGLPLADRDFLSKSIFLV